VLALLQGAAAVGGEASRGRSGDEAREPGEVGRRASSVVDSTMMLVPGSLSAWQVAADILAPVDHGPVVPIDDLPFAPNPGPQSEFVRSTVDVVIYGGQAGGGKTSGIIMVPARYSHVRGYDAILFRRNMTDALKPGSTWQETHRYYPLIGGKPNAGNHSWRFPSGATVTVAHLDTMSTVSNYDSSQIPCLLFDELTHFEEDQFWRMFARVRSVSGGPALVRGTCNPDPDSFVAELVSWYIDQETGLAMPERAGVVRWFVRSESGAIEWADDPDTLVRKFPADGKPHSFTFIPAALDDNPQLARRDPNYVDRLKLLPYVERERLLGGNWKVKPEAGKIFNRAWFKRLARIPEDVTLEMSIRYWDNAGTEGKRADRTAGTLMSLGSDGAFYITDCIAIQEEGPQRERIKKRTAYADGHDVHIYCEEEPGSAGKDQSRATIQNLAGFSVHCERPTGPKVTRWGPLAAQAEGGNVYVVGPDGASWIKPFLDELHNADGSDRVHDDRADTAAGAFNKLTELCTIGFM
jgi:predicted phage terminase large subunit-like protein